MLKEACCGRARRPGPGKTPGQESTLKSIGDEDDAQKQPVIRLEDLDETDLAAESKAASPRAPEIMFATGSSAKQENTPEMLLPKVEQRLISCETMIKPLQAALVNAMRELEALRTQVEDMANGKVDANDTKKDVNPSGEISQQVVDLQKELASFGVRLAVCEHTSAEVLNNDVHQRLQIIESANVIQRLQKIEIFQSKPSISQRSEEKLSWKSGSVLSEKEAIATTDIDLPFKEEEEQQQQQQQEEDFRDVPTHKKTYVDNLGAIVHHWMQGDEQYVFAHSTWDLAFFVGVDFVGSARSAWMIVMLVVNMIMQACLCLIIHDSFTIQIVDEDLIASLRLWRISIPHDFKWMDELTRRTLAKRICEGDTIPPISSSVADLLSTIDEYTIESGPRDTQAALGRWFYFADVGIFMTCMAVLIWWLSVLRELGDTHDFLIATKHLAVGERTEIKRTSDGRLVVNQLSRIRRVYLYVIIALKFLVAALLLYTGTCYLIFTIDISELLLNAAALAIVFEIDELVYASLSPRLAKLMIHEIEPLPRPRPMVLLGLDYRPLAKIVVLFIGMMCVIVFHLNPQNQDLKKARLEICGGNTDFVSVVDAYGAVLATNVGEEAIDASDVTSTYKYRAMSELVKDSTAATQRMSTKNAGRSWSATALGVVGSTYSVKTQAGLSVADNNKYWVTDCSDMPSRSECVSDPSCWRLFVLQAEDSAIQSCADAERHCGKDTLIGIRTRQYCPKTCGCDDPSSSNMFFAPNNGCGSHCTTTDKYQNTMTSRNCSDVSVTNPMFLQYMEGVEKAFQSIKDSGSGWREIAEPVRNEIRDNGCSPGLLSVYGAGYIINMCSDFNILNWKPLSFLCPVTCGCDRLTTELSIRLSTGKLCPHKCLDS